MQERRSKEVSLQGRKKSSKERIPGWQVGLNFIWRWSLWSWWCRGRRSPSPRRRSPPRRRSRSGGRRSRSRSPARRGGARWVLNLVQLGVSKCKALQGQESQNNVSSSLVVLFSGQDRGRPLAEGATPAPRQTRTPLDREASAATLFWVLRSQYQMFNNSTSMVSSWTLVNWTRWKSSNCLHQSVHLGVRTDGLFQLVQLVFIITFYECALYFVSIISYVPTLGRSTNFKEKGTNWRPLKWFKTLLPIVQTHYIQLFLCIDFNKFWKKTCLFFFCVISIDRLVRGQCSLGQRCPCCCHEVTCIHQTTLLWKLSKYSTGRNAFQTCCVQQISLTLFLLMCRIWWVMLVPKVKVYKLFWMFKTLNQMVEEV